MTPDLRTMHSPVSSVRDDAFLQCLCEGHEDLIPRVSVDSLAAEGRRQQTIGMGGNRGALVHLVDKRILRYRVYKEYVPPRRVSNNEMAFMSACYHNRTLAIAPSPPPPPAAEVSPHSLSSNDNENSRLSSGWCDALLDTAQQTLATNLVIPDALVVEGDEGRGVLMPLFHCNLFQLLTSVLPPLAPNKGEQGGLCCSDGSSTTSSFRSEQEFAPIADPQVIAALLYQITKGIVTLNYGLPHKSTTDGAQYSGFSHNDLHLANLLVHYDTGAVVLCDFELVEHLPPPRGVDPPCERIPCRSRHPPFGLWQESSDVWGLGLLAVDLLTGVVPIVDADNAFDDFGDGPLLELPSHADTIPVVDWDTNLGEHVAATRGVPMGACRATDDLYDFCRRCLSNTEEQEAAGSWAHSTDLLNLACFQTFVSGEKNPCEVVKSFFDLFGTARPNVVMNRSPNSNHSKPPLVLSTA